MQDLCRLSTTAEAHVLSRRAASIRLPRLCRADNAKPHTVVTVAGDGGAGGMPAASEYAAFMNKAVRQGFIRKVRSTWGR